MPRAQRDEEMLCAKMYSLPKVKVSRLYTAVSRMPDLLTAVDISKGKPGKPPNHWKIRCSLCIPWVWAGFEGKVFNFVVFTYWMYTKEVDAPGAQREEQMMGVKMY